MGVIHLKDEIKVSMPVIQIEVQKHYSENNMLSRLCTKDIFALI